jgi:tight adherence protein C
MNLDISLVAWVGIALVGFGIALFVYTMGKNPPVTAPRTGARGLKRARALQSEGSFKTIEPLMRLVAGWIAPFRMPKLRRKIDRQLVHAGDWLGLSADEFLALAVLSLFFFFGLGLVFCSIMELSPVFSFFFGGLGAMLPYTRVTGETQDRFKQINRGLPTAIDLASLCMGAGLDFPGALRQIADKAARKDDALTEELERILQELELGRTRRQALESFADRAPTDAVRDFVGAVVQAEEKGNPLAEVLRIQAGMLRMRRSVMAEESAARAAVMMMGPLMLIFCAIILILLGPFIINGMRSGF